MVLESTAFGFSKEQFAILAKWMARAEEAEARVRELERELHRLKNTDNGY